MPEQEAEGPQVGSRETTVVRAGSLVVSNVGKVLALVLVGHETFFTPGKPDYAVLALAALFYLGAQSAENIALRLVDRFLGQDHFRDER